MYSRNYCGDVCDIDKGICHCLVGAVCKAYGLPVDRYKLEYNDKIVKLADSIRQLFGSQYVSNFACVIDFNDKHSFEDVRKVIEHAGV